MVKYIILNMYSSGDVMKDEIKEEIVGFGKRKDAKFVLFVSERADIETAKKFVKNKRPKVRIFVNKTIKDFVPS